MDDHFEMWALVAFLFFFFGLPVIVVGAVAYMDHQERMECLKQGGTPVKDGCAKSTKGP